MKRPQEASRMRVGFDVSALCTPQPSGVGTYTANLYQQLHPLLQHNLIPLLPRPLGTPLGEGIVPVAPVRLNKTLWMQVVLPGQLAQWGVQVAHFTNHVAPLWSPCPTVLTIHDMTLWLYPEYHYRLRLWSMRPFIPLAARRAAAIITVSASAKADIVRLLHLPPEKIHVIPEAPAPLFQPLALEDPLRQQVRLHYEVPGPFFLHVGALEPRKNLWRLLTVFAQLRAAGAFTHTLVLVGTRGWKNAAIWELVLRLQAQGWVRWLGYVPLPQLVALYNEATALALPSLYEGFGLTALEAMACGTPVIASTRGGLREVVADAAEIVDPEDEPSLAHGLIHVLTNPLVQQALRHTGLAQAQHYSWAATARATHAIYQHLSQ